MPEAAPAVIETTRPADQPFPIVTAELVAFDRETLLLAQALGEQNDAASLVEAADRQLVTRDAGQQWEKARTIAPQLVRERGRGPSFDI